MKFSFVAAVVFAMVSIPALVIAQPAQPQPNGFVAFQAETERVEAATACPTPKVTPAMMSWGPLWSCVLGSAQTAKFFINGQAGQPGTQDVKVMWNEYTKNIGEGLAADRSEAQRLVSVAADLYAPSKKARIVEAFMGRRNTVITDGPYRLEYRYSAGPAAGEHLLTITARAR